MLKRREKCDTYLTHVCRPLEQREPGEKIKYRGFSQHCGGWKLYILSFHRVLSSSAKSTNVCQVGVTLLPFNIFYQIYNSLIHKYYTKGKILIYKSNWDWFWKLCTIIGKTETVFFFKEANSCHNKVLNF